MIPYSVVVVTWRSADDLRALVSSMNRFLPSRPELVVVDSASGDDPEAAAAHWEGPRRFVALAENRGYGAAANAGVREASGEVVVLLNPDTLVRDATLDRLAAEAGRRRALAGPRLLDADGSVQPSASGSPVGAWPWLGAVLPGALQPERLRARTEPWRLEGPVAVAWLTGACVAAPREALLDLGPFDEAIHLYAEDMDLGLRAARAGIPSWFLPDSGAVVHHGGASARARFGGREYGMAARNRRVVVRRVHGPRAERWSWRAERLRWWLRVLAKRALGREAGHDRRELEAARGAPAP